MTSTGKLKSRLKTITGLNSIFNAMQVITTVRMKKARERHTAFSNYIAGIEEAAGKMDFSPFIIDKPTGDTVLIFITSQRGLCGGFNVNLFNRLQTFAKQINRENPLRIIAVGKKGSDYVKARKYAVKNAYLEEDYDFSFFQELFAGLYTEYLAGKIASLHVMFNKYKSVIKQDTYDYRLLPPEFSLRAASSNVIQEPSKGILAKKIFFMLNTSLLFHFFLESKLGEASARLVTLKGAIESSDELISNLTINLNKARQQAITEQLLDLVGSSMGLQKGEE
ncbi:MAG: FoF1 ATP synthase subunit gamma [Candidatus Margulisbacteria bacterium]|nr:FoF1 ATP synthase subunit gamma [Candidatus Margulisiibacteriota bacterium]